MRYLLILLLCILPVLAEVNDTDIFVAFENGNLTNVTDGGVNVINGDYEYKTVYLWGGLGYCFKITGNYAGEMVTFNIGNFDYSGNFRPCYTYDGGETWYRGANGTAAAGTLTFSIAFEDKGSEVIVGADYYTNWTDLDSWVSGLSHADLSKMTCGVSEEGRDIHVLQITDTSVQDRLKKSVVLWGGVHPYEVVGTLTTQNVVKYLLTDTHYTNELRRRYKWVIYPVMNPDGFYGGLGRPNSNGVDLARIWEDDERGAAEVAAMFSHFDTIYPRPTLTIDSHGWGGTTSTIYRVHRPEVSFAMNSKIDKIRGLLAHYGPWTAESSPDTDGTPAHAIPVFENIPCAVIETSMVTAQSQVMLADNAKALVKAVNQYLIQ